MIEPFPIKARSRHTDLVRKYAMTMTPGDAKAYLRSVINEYRHYLRDIGVRDSLIEREIHDLQRAVTPSPTPSGGLRLAA